MLNFSKDYLVLIAYFLGSLINIYHLQDESSFLTFPAICLHSKNSVAYQNKFICALCWFYSIFYYFWKKKKKEQSVPTFESAKVLCSPINLLGLL